jgi:hypothetical protein
MHHSYPRGAFYLACMAAGVVLMLLFYFRSGQLWALWVWVWSCRLEEAGTSGTDSANTGERHEAQD